MSMLNIFILEFMKYMSPWFILTNGSKCQGRTFIRDLIIIHLCFKSSEDFQVSLHIFPERESLGHKAVPFLIFWGNYKQLSTVAISICTPTNSARGLPLLHILVSTCCLLIFFWWYPFWQMWVKWYLTVVLICISTQKPNQRNTCTLLFTAALFTIAKIWKQPKCPSVNEWIK